MDASSRRSCPLTRMMRKACFSASAPRLARFWSGRGAGWNRRADCRAPRYESVLDSQRNRVDQPAVPGVGPKGTAVKVRAKVFPAATASSLISSIAPRYLSPPTSPNAMAVSPNQIAGTFHDRPRLGAGERSSSCFLSKRRVSSRRCSLVAGRCRLSCGLLTSFSRVRMTCSPPRCGRISETVSHAGGVRARAGSYRGRCRGTGPRRR
jgi:hypothetical protein